jgi:hypothetical protein
MSSIKKSKENDSLHGMINGISIFFSPIFLAYFG